MTIQNFIPVQGHDLDPMTKHLQSNGINVELVEKDCGIKIRNYCSLDPDQKGAETNSPQNVWDRPFFSAGRKQDGIEERFSTSRVALRVNIHQKRKG